MRTTSLQTRHILDAGDKRTTIALETAFWWCIESLAEVSGSTWREWMLISLQDRPAQVGRASWIRCKVADQLRVAATTKARGRQI